MSKSDTQTTKTVAFCERHDRFVPTGADCPLCTGAGMETRTVEKIHFSDLPKDEQKTLLEILRTRA